MIKGHQYLTKIRMPPMIDTEGDEIAIEVKNSNGKIWK